ncbi:MAG TPA: hypothetical protein VJG67_01600 [Candidatus Paceibacterota bacterium]
MEPKFQTSFIPKKPIGSPQSSVSGVIRSTNIMSVVATVVFLVTVLTSGALFLYKSSLNSQIADAKTQIDNDRVAFQPDKIKDLVDVDSRIKSAEALLNNHIVLSDALVRLNQLTLKKMQFSDLEYLKKPDGLALSIVGEVQTYNALAEQERIFKESDLIRDPNFGSFSLGDNGYILVNFSATLNPSLLSYKNAIESTNINQ